MNTKTEASTAIPSAGADMRHLLDQDVVIDGDANAAPTGAQSVEPSHSPRAPLTGSASAPHKINEIEHAHDDD